MQIVDPKKILTWCCCHVYGLVNVLVVHLQKLCGWYH